MELLVSFRVVAPLILYMAAGALLRRFRIIDEAGFRGANLIVFYLAVPALCFRSLLVADLGAMIETPFMLYVGLGITLLFALSMLLVPRFSHDDARRGVLVLGIFRSNEGIFGLAIAAALFSADRLTFVTLAVSMSIPLCNVLSVVAMERYCGTKTSFGRLLIEILKNPILIGCLLGFAANLAGLRLPEALDTPIAGFASITTPLAFVAIGGTLSFGSVRKNRVALTTVTLLRLVVIPIAAVIVFRLLGYPKDAVAAALFVFGAPSAMVTYNMAASLGADKDLAAAIVATTSVLATVTMFLFVFAFRSLGVI